MRGKKHSDQTRAAAIAALLEGQGVTEVARRYNLPHPTVSNLKSSLSSTQLNEVRQEKVEELAALIENHLHTSLQAAANIAKQTENADWRNKQTADDLGVFYGILTDKAVRILEAAEAAAPTTEEWPEDVQVVCSTG